MKDVLDELAAARRTMGTAALPAGDAYTMELRRRYDAPIEDVWNAITDPERLDRWLKSVTGDFRLGRVLRISSMIVCR
ncbi:SRPBCC domain-containing protein [Amycolatopsis sp. QT-25]|uniref:SRPBCC domain-containing protein n=1 Tax=Amycolatopsis sp. QT-25 TaxID=3034022 RepID=UPI0023ECC8B5|nr:SRPBCC domain-containing protein [Amycolatopsis sp. QT-25]WET76432.1 SRPBCC domain-containing protein [Amycolatopsis sp. QT-25]